MSKIKLDTALNAVDAVTIAFFVYFAVTSQGWMSIAMWILAAILLLALIIRIRRGPSAKRSN